MTELAKRIRSSDADFIMNRIMVGHGNTGGSKCLMT